MESGLVVVDVDPRNGGDQSIKGLHLPPTFTSSTGGGGWHYFYALKESLAKKSAALPGIDLQANGAYVVMPPSLHRSGKRYECDDNVIAPAPAWVLDALKQSTPTPAAFASNGQVTEGLRDDTLFKAGCGFIRGSCAYCGGRVCAQTDPGHLFKRLMALNTKKLNPPLEQWQVQKIVMSVIKTVQTKGLGTAWTARTGRQ